MAKPQPEGRSEIATKNPLEELYQLNYIQGNSQRFRILRFAGEVSLDEIVRKAKAYCLEKNYRFVFIEPAITEVATEREAQSA